MKKRKRVEKWRQLRKSNRDRQELYWGLRQAGQGNRRRDIERKGMKGKIEIKIERGRGHEREKLKTNRRRGEQLNNCDCKVSLARTLIISHTLYLSNPVHPLPPHYHLLHMSTPLDAVEMLFSPLQQRTQTEGGRGRDRVECSFVFYAC